MELRLCPLSRDHYILASKSAENSSQKNCFKPEKIKEIRNVRNCTQFCIPFMYKVFFKAIRVFFNKSAEIKTCEKFDDYFCAIMEIDSYLREQQLTCMKPMIEQNFIGYAKFQDEFSNYHPHTINGERKERILMQLCWMYQSNVTMISEERLVYDPRGIGRGLHSDLCLLQSYF